MMLWMILTILCSAAAVLVAAPFLRASATREAAGAADMTVYRDQLEEIEREADVGQIDEAQAEGARAEIRRRLLLADRGKASMTAHGTSLAGNQVAIVGIAGTVVLGSVILYATMGRPDLPASNGTRVVEAPTSRSTPTPAGGGSPDAPPPAIQNQSTAAGAAPGLGSVDEMIERIVGRLKQNPGNAEDWRMLGWSYFGTERFAEAAEAYGKAATLQPRRAELLASQGEAMVRATQGAVTPEAKAVFEATLRLDAKEPRSRFFLGLAKEQAGDKAAALSDWVAIVTEADPAEPWVADLRQRIAELAQQTGAAIPDIAKIEAGRDGGGPPPLALLKDAEPAVAPTPAVPASGPPLASGQRGPTPDDVKAAQALSPQDRNAMIKGMVDGLAARLEKAPRDADGWIKLIRSRKVLGEEAAASETLKKALAIFADAPAERAQIVAAAMELQVKP